MWNYAFFVYSFVWFLTYVPMWLNFDVINHTLTIYRFAYPTDFNHIGT
jgi:hypothetical protein